MRFVTRECKRIERNLEEWNLNEICLDNWDLEKWNLDDWNLEERLNKPGNDRYSETPDKIDRLKIKIRESIVVEGRDDSAAVLSAVDADIIITNGFHLRKPVVERMARALASNGLIVLTDPDFAGEGIRRQIEKILADRNISGECGEAAECASMLEHRYSDRQAHTIKHARLVAEDASKNGDIGIENASPDMILEALLHSGASVVDNFSTADELYACKMHDIADEPQKMHDALPNTERSGDSVKQSAKRSENENQPLTYADLLALGLTGEGSRVRRIKIGRRLGIGYANAGQFLQRLRRKGISTDMLRRLTGGEEKTNEG